MSHSKKSPLARPPPTKKKVPSNLRNVHPAHTLIALLTLAVVLLTAFATAWTVQHEVHVIIIALLVIFFAPVVDVITGQISWIGPMPVGSTYTCWNCLLVAYTIVDHMLTGRAPLLLPFLVINSWAVFAAFNVVQLIDTTFWVRAAAWTGYGMGTFHVFNIAFHVLPPIGCTVWFLMQPEGTCNALSMTKPCLSTMAFHASWIIRSPKTIFPNKIYFQCPKWQWCLAWITALIVHVLAGREVSGQCGMVSKLRG
mmetsp:Transcript_41715/g.73292  ORF Transcript_41715/g.73292 Transcript_41715/m.73292 type:complete len:254 (+) Transcript_41715:69-830(+)